MRRSSRWMLSFSVLLVWALTACGSTDEPVGVTVEPPAPLTFVPGCATTDLENWLEHIYFLSIEFVNVMSQGADQPRQELGPTVQRMVDLRDMIVNVPAPDACATDTHRLVNEMMNTALVDIQAYANGADIDLNAALWQTNATLSGVQTAISLLQERLEAQFAAERGED